MWRAARPVPSLARMDICGGMVKLVYTEALKASSPQGECGFDSHSRYQAKVNRTGCTVLFFSFAENRRVAVARPYMMYGLGSKRAISFAQPRTALLLLVQSNSARRVP